MLTSSTKYISPGEFPHASEELCQSTAKDGHSDDDVGGLNATRLEVINGQHKCCWCEGEQAARWDEIQRLVGWKKDRG